MTSLEKRAREYAHKTGEFFADAAFIAGAMSERRKILKWHNPTKRKPQNGQLILVKRKNCGRKLKYTVARYVEGNTMFDFGEIISNVAGWRAMQ